MNYCECSNQAPSLATVSPRLEGDGWVNWSGLATSLLNMAYEVSGLRRYLFVTPTQGSAAIFEE